MQKLDKQLPKTTTDKTSGKFRTYAIILIGLLIGFGLFALGMAMLDPFITEYTSKKDIVSLYDFYDSVNNSNQTAVYFLGNSIVGAAIYPPGINENVQSKGSNIRTYNLYLSNDQIIQRVLQMNTIINTAPALVIYGITYSDVAGDGSWVSERATLVQDRLNVSETAYPLFTSDELSEILNKPNIFAKKQYMNSAVRTIIAGDTDWTYDVDYTTDPRGMEARLAKSASKDYNAIVAEANDVTNGWHPEITNQTTRSKEALNYSVRTLQNAGIPVLVINMPLHPLISEKITNESRQNYFDYLNSTGAKWINMETMFGDECFYDSHHTSWNGTQAVTPVITDIIIQELS